MADKKGNNLHRCNRCLVGHVTEWEEYYVVAYNYDNKYIDAVLVADLKDSTIVETVKVIFKAMEEKDHRPCLNVTDNQVVKPLKTYLKNQGLQVATCGTA